MSQSSHPLGHAGQRLRLALLSLSLVGAVLGMHGFTDGVTKHQVASMGAMAMAHLPTPPAARVPLHPAGHHGHTAAAHHGCVATQFADSPNVAAPSAHLVAPPLGHVANAARVTARSRTGRAPPDLTELCVSRT